MAPTTLTVQTLNGPRASYNAAVGSIYSTPDTVNGNDFVHPGGIVEIRFQNASGSTMNISVTAVAGSQTKQMAENKTLAILNGSHAGIRVAYDDGYVNSSGKVAFTIDQSSSSYVGVFRIT